MVSVLIPTYNRPQLLLRALGSLPKGTTWEALVVDDGDGSGMQAARALDDPRIKSFTNQGKGQVAARNTALAQARYPYIALLDDDDWIEDPLHFSKALRAAKRDALVYRGGWLVNTERTPFNFTATAAKLRLDNLILASGVVYPRHFHTQLGIFDLDMGDYWDWDWYLRVSAKYPLAKLRGLGIAIFQHSSNMSYGNRQQERQANLDRLIAKHGLKDVTLKDHSSLARTIAPSATQT
jgi:glycosyltransferase involved in cell wall biosynthesis